MENRFYVPKYQLALRIDKCCANGKNDCGKFTQYIVGKMPTKDELLAHLIVLNEKRAELEAHNAQTRDTSISLDMEYDSLVAEYAEVEARYNAIRHINQRYIGFKKRSYSF